ARRARVAGATLSSVAVVLFSSVNCAARRGDWRGAQNCPV
ncbi:hypothetical protein A2U01_0086617, partial [Trifolium medium]|nr:hypothetical protein [Trifolium medium]